MSRPRTRAGRRVLTSVAAGLAVLAVVACFAMFVSVQPIAWLSAELRHRPLPALVLTMLGLMVAGIAVAGRRLLALVLAGLCVLTSALTVLVPVLSQAGAAADAHAEVSVGEFLGEPFGSAAEPEPTSTVRYAAPGGHQLRMDFWRSEVPGKRPAVLYLHGGAWRAGERGDAPRWKQLLGQRGFDVFAADYRMAGDVPEGTAWRASIADAKCAAAWVAANADDFDIDPNRITVFGQSAGAQLAMMVAYTRGDPEFSPSCPLPEPKVKSVIDLYGPTDFPEAVTGPGRTAKQTGILRELFGGELDRFPQRYRAASPISHIRQGLPPTLILAGEADHLVPVEQSRSLAAALAGANVVHSTTYLPFADHGFDSNWSSYATQLSRHEVTRFITRHG
ncbi:alpha/beta hydrolase [Tamaricihabitans halophyticus]|uniref:alpha/beta hydrolase n=1 Tax=Tamaricihabitans halophyticus TaxID=1262583 RepID=UPI00104E908D|nr:alpha/beta hydrolase [Tamaricihabitans halophyticus]